MKGNKKLTEEAFIELKKATEIETDYKLAQELKLPSSTIYRYSNGVNSISLDKLAEYAEILNKKVIIKFINKKK